MELYQEGESCESVDVYGISFFLALRCVDGKLGRAYYNEPDSTCSFDVVMVETDIYSCVTSAIAAGPYLGADCTSITGNSYFRDNDDASGRGNVSLGEDVDAWEGEDDFNSDFWRSDDIGDGSNDYFGPDSSEY